VRVNGQQRVSQRHEHGHAKVGALHALNGLGTLEEEDFPFASSSDKFVPSYPRHATDCFRNTLSAKSTAPALEGTALSIAS